MDEFDDECDCDPCKGAQRRPRDAEGEGCEREPDEPVVLEPIRQGDGFAVYRWIPRLQFTWDNLQSGGSLVYVAARYIPVFDVTDALLVVRQHGSSRLVGDGHIDFEVQSVSISADEPETTFSSTVATLRMDATTEFRSCLTAPLAAVLGSHVRLQATFVRGTSGAQDAVVSVDLVVRRAREQIPPAREPSPAGSWKDASCPPA